MAYVCPKCGGKAQRHVGNSRGAGIAFGAVGALLAAAFSFQFECPRCGQLELSEMPPGTGGKVFRSSALLVGIALALLAGVIALLVYVPL